MVFSTCFFARAIGFTIVKDDGLPRLVGGGGESLTGRAGSFSSPNFFLLLWFYVFFHSRPCTHKAVTCLLLDERFFFSLRVVVVDVFFFPLSYTIYTTTGARVCVHFFVYGMVLDATGIRASTRLSALLSPHSFVLASSRVPPPNAACLFFSVQLASCRPCYCVGKNHHQSCVGQ